jgi:hypothetical protein
VNNQPPAVSFHLSASQLRVRPFSKNSIPPFKIHDLKFKIILLPLAKQPSRSNPTHEIQPNQPIQATPTILTPPPYGPLFPPLNVQLCIFFIRVT